MTTERTEAELRPGLIYWPDGASFGMTGMTGMTERGVSAFCEAYAVYAGETCRQFEAIAERLTALLGEPVLSEASGDGIVPVVRDMAEDGIGLCRTVASLVAGYRNMASVTSELYGGAFNPVYIQHREAGIASANAAFNELFRDIDSWTFGLFDTIDMLRDGVEADILGRCKALLARRKVIARRIEDRMMFMDDTIRSLREDSAKLRLQTVEAEVAERRRKMEERRQRVIIEDVKDYADLEGNDRTAIDDGNAVEEDDAYAGESSGSVKPMIFFAVVAVIVAGAYFYFVGR